MQLKIKREKSKHTIFWLPTIHHEKWHHRVNFSSSCLTQVYFRMLDALLSEQKMPDEYLNQTQVPLCSLWILWRVYHPKMVGCRQYYVMTVVEKETPLTIGSITSTLLVPPTTPDFSNGSNFPPCIIVHEQVLRQLLFLPFWKHLILYEKS